MEKEAQPVVLEVAETVTDSLDLLHEQVHGFGGAVGESGGVPGEDLGLPSADGAGEALELGNLEVSPWA